MSRASSRSRLRAARGRAPRSVGGGPFAARAAPGAAGRELCSGGEAPSRLQRQSACGAVQAVDA
eukprot:10086910-Alexandrium_andersonii.AAC.1